MYKYSNQYNNDLCIYPYPTPTFYISTRSLSLAHKLCLVSFWPIFPRPWSRTKIMSCVPLKPHTHTHPLLCDFKLVFNYHYCYWQSIESIITIWELKMQKKLRLKRYYSADTWWSATLSTSHYYIAYSEDNTILIIYPLPHFTFQLINKLYTPTATSITFFPIPIESISLFVSTFYASVLSPSLYELRFHFHWLIN